MDDQQDTPNTEATNDQQGAPLPNSAPEQAEEDPAAGNDGGEPTLQGSIADISGDTYQRYTAMDIAVRSLGGNTIHPHDLVARAEKILAFLQGANG